MNTHAQTIREYIAIIKNQLSPTIADELRDLLNKSEEVTNSFGDLKGLKGGKQVEALVKLQGFLS